MVGTIYGGWSGLCVNYLWALLALKADTHFPRSEGLGDLRGQLLCGPCLPSTPPRKPGRRVVSPEGQAEPLQGDRGAGSKVQRALKHEAWVLRHHQMACFPLPGPAQVTVPRYTWKMVQVPVSRRPCCRGEGFSGLCPPPPSSNPNLTCPEPGAGRSRRRRAWGRDDRALGFLLERTNVEPVLQAPWHRSPKGALGGDSWTHHPRCWSGALRVGCPLGLPGPLPPGLPHPAPSPWPRPLTLAPPLTGLRSRPSPDPAPCPCTGVSHAALASVSP